MVLSLRNGLKGVEAARVDHGRYDIDCVDVKIQESAMYAHKS